MKYLLLLFILFTTNVTYAGDIIQLGPYAVVSRSYCASQENWKNDPKCTHSYVLKQDNYGQWQVLLCNDDCGKYTVIKEEKDHKKRISRACRNQQNLAKVLGNRGGKYYKRVKTVINWCRINNYL